MDVEAGVALIIGAVVLVCLAGGIAVRVFYLLTLQRALERCSPQNRTMTPGLVWLLFIPVFATVWQFFVVLALGKSLGNEYRSRGMSAPSRPGRSLGLAMACADAVGLMLGIALYAVMFVEMINEGNSPDPAWPGGVGGFGGILSLASLVLWIIYWVTIHKFSKRLVEARYQPAATPSPYGSVESYCWQCGMWIAASPFCPRCGARQRPDEPPQTG